MNLNIFNEIYRIDKDGSVYALWQTGRHYRRLRKDPLKMKSQKDKDGYHRYTLRDANNKQYTVFKHRIIMLLSGQCGTKYQTQINHIDGDKDNNTISNLEWCTDSENKIHRYSKLGQKSKQI